MHLIASEVDRAAEWYGRVFGAVVVNRGEVSGAPQAWQETKIAFIEGPDGVRVELLERSGRPGSATATAPKGI